MSAKHDIANIPLRNLPHDNNPQPLLKIECKTLKLISEFRMVKKSTNLEEEDLEEHQEFQKADCSADGCELNN